MRWMLDTATCIAVIKKRPERALKKLRGKSIGQVGISSITLGELAFGASKSSRSAESHAALNEFLLPLEVADFDYRAAMQYGEVRASLTRDGTPIGPLDTLIAAHAAAIEAILVTQNTREFGRIDALRLEDWLKA
jgi:tRNA(fMet)-specific endonuclease VapC